MYIYIYMRVYVYFDFILTCVYMHVSFYTYPHEPFIVQRINQGPAPTANRCTGQGRVLTFQRWPMDLGFREDFCILRLRVFSLSHS